jgi:2,4-dienoyl-CoA reductase-like NADH-dependent reductase (Old Yellow Enzyme family)
MTYLNKKYANNRLTIKNRIVMPPMATSKSDATGLMNHQILTYYKEITASKKIGLVITEHCYISKKGKAHEGQLSIAEDTTIEGWKHLAAIIHEHEALAIAQISHAGSATNATVTGESIVAPSPVRHPNRQVGDIPSALNMETIQQIVELFVQAAVRVEAAGFDGVEIHAAHGYLLNQFYSPLSNKREDAYGGDVLGRIRILLDIIKSIREKTRPDFLVLVRLGGEDYTEGGNTIEDAVAAAVALENAGIDLLDISGGFFTQTQWQRNVQGVFKEVTGAIRKHVQLPVILTGGITEPGAAEALIAEGYTDFVGIGKALLRDSNWPVRALE